MYRTWPQNSTGLMPLCQCSVNQRYTNNKIRMLVCVLYVKVDVYRLDKKK